MTCGHKLHEQNFLNENEVLIVVKMAVLVVWVVTLCRLTGSLQRFGGIYCLHLHLCFYLSEMKPGLYGLFGLISFNFGVH
jgi:hypothetical protein